MGWGWGWGLHTHLIKSTRDHTKGSRVVTHSPPAGGKLHELQSRTVVSLSLSGSSSLSQFLSALDLKKKKIKLKGPGNGVPSRACVKMLKDPGPSFAYTRRGSFMSGRTVLQMSFSPPSSSLPSK